ncbi:NADPH:quinone reductase [Pedobacter steynii]|uniref:NADPH:quinone reductase n=2 Tax=Pedobacter steynii TaxID=430522 RepID=A0A1H0JQT3_9SPHI|nr:NAD(P)-dependent alcohol dehydrogenase [Pedobacter steynii]SDO45889.1 NADPH:quinone reductase [Pedobacter steynii]
MKAAIRYEYCTPDLLEIARAPLPGLGDDEILVKVKATTVNRTDCGVLTGKPWAIRLFIGLFEPVRPVTGTDFAGIVVDKGKNVDQFEIGDHAYGFFDEGLSSHAEYVAVSTKKAVLKKPENVTFEQAAASLEGAHYAFYFLKDLKLNAGDRILINGGTGAIGNATLQFLKHFKVRVTVTCETEFVEVLKSQGAERVIDYQKEDFTTINEQFDYVFDAVGKSTFKKCKPLLKSKGIYISSELGENWQNPIFALLSPFMAGKKVKFALPYSIKRSMKFIHELVLNGEFVPLIDRRYRFEDIEKAYYYVLSGQKKGNVIITFD